MSSNINQVEESIRRMTAVVRQSHATTTAKSFGEDPNLSPRGWWVLACGEKLDETSIEQRDKAREQLLRDARMAGIVLPENIWVWDEEGVAQLVISSVPSLERAHILADHLRKKGLTIRIKRETF